MKPRKALKRSRKKKTPTQLTIQTADRLWSKAILKRDNGICQKCGKQGNNPHHIFTRAIKHLRHDMANGILLCSYCHVFGKESAHMGAEAFRDFILKRGGEKKYFALKLSSSMVIKPDYEMSILFLKQFLGEYGVKEN